MTGVVLHGNWNKLCLRFLTYKMLRYIFQNQTHVSGCDSLSADGRHFAANPQLPSFRGGSKALPFHQSVSLPSQGSRYNMEHRTVD